MLIPIDVDVDPDADASVDDGLLLFTPDALLLMFESIKIIVTSCIQENQK